MNPLVLVAESQTTAHQAQESFDALKSCFIFAPVRSIPDPDRQFLVEVDASDLSGAHKMGRCTLAPFFPSTEPS